MAPKYPYPPVYRPRRHSVVDITITSIVSAVAGIAALGSLWFSLFFAMATDSCGEQCNYAALNAAYLVTWGGVAVAVIVAAAGNATPIKQSRVTIAASWSSSQPSVPSGRTGITMKRCF